MTTKTGLFDSDGIEIKDGDFVSLAGNMTADDSVDILPNGWTFDETDIYQVYLDERIGKWSLMLGVEPDSPYNCKYMSHAVSLLHDRAVKIADKSNKAVNNG